ncbi:MAG: hypothetical protein JXB88_20940 [Spirochaetales bacterium]|nr:hypothetical protein [Spirochaetales bacterium]
MNHIKTFFILILFFCIYHCPVQGLELIKTKKWDVNLSLRLAPAYVFNYPSLLNGFEFYNMEIEFECEYDNRVELALAFDLMELYEGSGFVPGKLIEDAYLNYNFHKFLKIRAGQYKVPLGEEIALGMSERPYYDHSLGSRRLAPGRRQGLMFSGKEIFSFLGYQAGIFNTSETDKEENESPYLSTAGKLILDFDEFPGIYLKSSYSIYYSFDEIFAQAASQYFSWQFFQIHKLTLFGEYLEQRFYHYHWNNSIFLLLAYRAGLFEIYSSGEFYDENVGKEDKDDCFSLCSGINLYWIKDRLRTSLGHRYTNEYQKGEEKNRFVLVMMWEI